MVVTCRWNLSFSFFFQLVFSFNGVSVRVGALRGQKRGLNPLKLELQEPSVGAGNRTLVLCESNGTSCRLSCGSQHLYVLNASVCCLVHLLYNGHRLLVLWGEGCQRQPSGVSSLWRLNSVFQAQALLPPSPVTDSCMAPSSQPQPSLHISWWGEGWGWEEVLISVSGE